MSRKPNSRSEKKAASTDEFHNESVPCCALIQQITHEIFPEVQTEDEDENHPPVEEKEPPPQPRSRTAAKRTNSSLSASDAPSSSPASSTSSLLSRLIRTYLLEQHAKRKGGGGGQGAVSSSSSSAAKKRRKRKKKKAKDNSTSSITSAATTTSTTIGASTTSNDQATTTTTTTTTDHDKKSPQQKEGHVSSSQDVSHQTTAAAVATATSTTAATSCAASNSSVEPDVVVTRWLHRIMSKEGDEAMHHPQGSPDEHRDFASFVTYLVEEQSRQHDKRQQQEQDHLQEPWMELSAVQVRQAVDSIACRDCRTSAQNYLSTALERNDPIVLTPRMLKPPSSQPLAVPTTTTTTTTTGGLENDFERAFDYVAMEEGLPPADDDEEEEPGSSCCSWTVVARDDDSEKRLFVATKEISLAHIEEWIRLMLLPCGLPMIAEDVNEYALDDQELKAIQMHVTDFADRMLDDIAQTREKKQRLQQQFGEAGDSYRLGANFDMRTASLLMECDPMCDELLENLGSILYELTVEYIAFVVSAESWVSDPVEALWDVYNRTIAAMLKAALDHEGRWLQLVNRPGVIPQMYTDFGYRSSFLTMIDCKLSALTELQESVEGILLTPVKQDGRRSFLRKFAAYRAFFDVTPEGRAYDQKRGSDDLDSACRALLKEHAELSYTSTCHGSVKDMIQRQSERCEAVEKQMEKVNRLLCARYDSISSSVSSNAQSRIRFLQDVYSSEFSATQCNNENGADDEVFDELDSKHWRLQSMRNKLESLSKNVIYRWRLLGSVQTVDHGDESFSRRAPPQRLMEWLGGGQDHEIKYNQPEFCRGGGGRRRVVCILMGLLYRWMVCRCDEWNAKLSEVELLQAVDHILELDASNRGTQLPAHEKQVRQKRTRKKREKKAPNTPKGLPRSLADATEDDNFSNPQSPKESTPLKNMDKADEDATPTAVEAQTKNAAKSVRNTEDESDHIAGMVSEHSRKPDSTSCDRRKQDAEYQDLSSEGNRLIESNGKSQTVIGTVADSKNIVQEEVAQSAGKTGDHPTRASSVVMPDENSTLSQAVGGVSNASASGGEKIPSSVSWSGTAAQVGVHSSTGFQSAEGYLVERLLAVLRETKEGGKPSILRL